MLVAPQANEYVPGLTNGSMFTAWQGSNFRGGDYKYPNPNPGPCDSINNGCTMSGAHVHMHVWIDWNHVHTSVHVHASNDPARCEQNKCSAP
jgi:hypothetical protein